MDGQKAGVQIRGEDRMPLLVLFGSLILSILIIVLTIVYFNRRKRRVTVVIVGLSDGGKTTIFTKLITKYQSDWTVYKSMAENAVSLKTPKGEILNLIDYPGAERMRGQLFKNYFGDNLANLRSVVFVIDSDTFSKKTRDVAELLYEIISQTRKTKIPLLIVCNKQDLDTSKSSTAIRNLLEKELGLICKTSNSTLESTSDTKTKAVLAEDGEFSWEKHCPNHEFVNFSSSTVGNVDVLKSWIFNN